MNIITKAELRKPLSFDAWHLRRYEFEPLEELGCGGPKRDCTHFYACYLSSLESLRRGKFKKIRRGRK